MKSLNCPYGNCLSSGKSNVGVVIRYGFYRMTEAPLFTLERDETSLLLQGAAT